MVSKFIFWLKGFCLITISAKNGERFLNLCKNQKIFLKDIHRTKKYITFVMPAKQFVHLLLIAHKTKTVPHILKKRGFPFVIRRYRRKKIFFAGAILFSVMLYILSLFLWDIEVKGNHRISKDTLMKFLSSQQVYTGVQLANINCQQLETDIRNTYDNIAWVSAEIKGTRLILNISETEKSTLELADTLNESHLIASCDGTVSQIITSSGTQMVKVNDHVKKGQILIAGIIEYKDDSKTVVSKSPVAAQGDVILKCTRTYEDKFPLLHQEKIYTGRMRSKIGLQFGTTRFLLPNLIKQFETYEKYDIIKNNCPITLGKNFVLPVQVLHQTEWEYEWQERTYSLKEAKQLASDKYHAYLTSLTDQSITIDKEINEYQILDNEAVIHAKIYTQEVQNEHKNINEEDWRVESPDANGTTDGNTNGT